METTELYGGRIKLVFDPVKHLYSVGGGPVDGVTSVLGVIAKPALVPWAVKMTAEAIGRAWKPGVASDEIEIARAIADAKMAHRRKTEDAAAIGTLVHRYAENVLKGLPAEIPTNAEARRSCEAFEEWRIAHLVRARHVERKVYSTGYSYAGTCDLVAVIDGAETVADVKTSSGIYSEMFYQVSAYKEALVEEEVVSTYADRAIIRFDKLTGAFEFKPLKSSDHEADYEAFLAALALHRRQKMHNPPRGRKAA
jgi:hypothetical protein